MTKISKKIKIVTLKGTVKKGKVGNQLAVTEELYSHLFSTLPQYLLDVHKYTNIEKQDKVQLLIKTRENNGKPESLYKSAKEHQYICGIVEKGITGKKKKILDSSENKLVGVVNRSEAVLSPVFFMLVFSWKYNSLFMLTENDASENIYSDIISAIRSSITAFHSDSKFTLKTEIVLGSDKIIDYIKDGQYSQIKIKRNNLPPDIADQIYNIKIEEGDECTIEVKIAIKKKGVTGALADKIRTLASDGTPSFRTIEELSPLGLDEDSDIVVDSTLNGTKRPITISSLKTPNISQVIEVMQADDGYADFDSIREESLYLFQDIVKYM